MKILSGGLFKSPYIHMYMCICGYQVYVDIRFMYLSGLCLHQVCISIKFMCLSDFFEYKVYVQVYVMV